MTTAGKLLCMGNPLLDVSAVVTQEFLDKYSLKLDNQILIETDEQRAIFPDMVSNFEVEYIAGGATQNSARVAQWMLGEAGSVTYMGCVGKDEFAAKMTEVAGKDGMVARYMEDATTATGSCAVCVVGGERSLAANLSAANNYKVDHLKLPENWACVEKASFFYMAGFFITVSPESIMEVAKHAAANRKTFMMNLSAPFIMEVPPFKEALMNAMPFIDFLFGNESEAETFAKTEGWETRDVSEIALKIADFPKATGTRPRVVVITQGAEATVVACGGKVMTYPVIKLAKEQLVDTNGAGDSFVGGFLAQLVAGKGLEECCRSGNYCANVVIQQSGCAYPAKPDFNDATAPAQEAVWSK